uniref:Uncharacterized protein n=1 Tax=viral metagenome TaxID=1070528 RepID=A0A6C0E1U4_9ZZZZ
MTDLIKESLNKVKQTLQNSTQQIVTFKQQNKDFKNQLIAKITSILTQIQELSKNPNSANLKVVLADLDATKKQLQKTQQELGIANQRLQSNQTEIASLKQERQRLEEMSSMSAQDSQGLVQKMKDIEAKLKEKEAFQAEILENIKQVNDLLVQQVTNISEMVQESTGYNKEYDTQINAIETNLQNVVQLLNNESGSNAPTTNGGRSRRRNRKKTHKKYFKGGYNWSIRSSSPSLSKSRRSKRVSI